MKSSLLLSIVTLNLANIRSQPTCCQMSQAKPNVSNMEPVNGYTANVNEWITFKAEVTGACGVCSVNINIQGYALTNHEVRETIGCPSGYFCKDYRFPTMGENWWNIKAIDNCGMKRITGDAHFCIGACPRYLSLSVEALSNKDALSNIDAVN